MNLYRALRIVLLIPLIVIAGCGSNDAGFDPNEVTVAVSPATDTIAASDTVTLQAAVHNMSFPGRALLLSPRATEIFSY